VAGLVDGAGKEAGFNNPIGIALYIKENILYVADHYNNMIRKITSSGVVTSYTGTHIRGSIDGPTRKASLDGPIALAVDQRNGDLYISEYNGHKIRRIIHHSERTFAQYLVDKDGTPTKQHRISLQEVEMLPAHLWLDVISLCDERTLVQLSQTCSAFYNPAQRCIGGYVTTVAGNGKCDNQEGIASNCSFAHPCGLCFSEEEEVLYIVDHNNNRIKKLDMKTKMVSTVAGTDRGFADGEGTVAKFQRPIGIALIKSDQSLLVADFSNHRIRHIEPGAPAVVKTLAGEGTYGDTDGNGLTCTFGYPRSLCIDPLKNVCYVVSGQTVRMISLP